MNTSTQSPVAGPSVIEKLEIESDGKLLRVLGASLLLGAGIVSYSVTMKVGMVRSYLPSGIVEPIPEEKPIKVTFTSSPKPRPQLSKRPDRKPPSSARSGRGKPDAAPTRLVVTEISALSDDVSLSPRALLGSVFNRDVERVLEGVTALTRSGQNRVGVRRGRPGVPFNPGAGDGTGDGRELVLDRVWDSGPEAFKHDIKTPVKVEKTGITMTLENSERSSESILRSIRQHTPGLRHIYNRHLKLHPGFQGKVTLRFTISPAGIVVELGVAASTTGVPEFDADIRRQVMSWRFEPVRGLANDVVAVPFTFSE